MTIAGLTLQEFWTGVIAFSIVPLIYLIRDMADEAAAFDDNLKWRWGMKARRPRALATWGSHLIVAPIALTLAIFIISALKRF